MTPHHASVSRRLTRHQVLRTRDSARALAAAVARLDKAMQAGTTDDGALIEPDLLAAASALLDKLPALLHDLTVQVTITIEVGA